MVANADNAKCSTSSKSVSITGRMTGRYRCSGTDSSYNNNNKLITQQGEIDIEKVKQN